MSFTCSSYFAIAKKVRMSRIWHFADKGEGVFRFMLCLVSVRTRGDGVEAVRTFCRQGVSFSWFVRTSFMYNPYCLLDKMHCITYF